MNTNPQQNQNQKKFYSFCDLHRTPDNAYYFGVMEGGVYNIKQGPRLRKDQTPVLDSKTNLPLNVLSFSVRLSNVSKKFNYVMGEYNPETKQSIQLLDPNEETIFVNVETIDSNLIERFNRANVKNKDRLILSGSLVKYFSQQQNKWYITLHLSDFKITKRSDVSTVQGENTHQQPIYGAPQVDAQPYMNQAPMGQGYGYGTPAQPAPAMPAQPAPAMPAQPASAMPAQPASAMPAQGYGYGTPAAHNQAPYGNGAPTNFQGQSDFASQIQIDDADLPF